MKFGRQYPPRKFRTGADATVEMSDCGTIDLATDEQVTFVTSNGAEYDVARKSWGFYATPSLNDRLPRHGLRAALCANTDDKIYILLVETGYEDAFEAYLKSEAMRVVHWLDDGNITVGGLQT